MDVQSVSICTSNVATMTKSDGIRIRIEPDLKRRFLEVCSQKDIPAAQVIRSLMKKYIKDNPLNKQKRLFGE